MKFFPGFRPPGEGIGLGGGRIKLEEEITKLTFVSVGVSFIIFPKGHSFMYSFFWFNDAHHYFLVDDTVDDANQEGDRSSSCMKTLYKLNYVLYKGVALTLAR